MSKQSHAGATAVIGAAYGDEGKGLLTDAFAAPAGADAIVVRFNGGAQAGHTVVAPDGHRHVFHHVASGSLAGAETHLSRFFVTNPILFHRELEALAGLGVAPRITVDPRAIVTLPHDMMLNQIVERARGSARHGSCGVGFGEAIERSLAPGLTLTVGDITDRASLRALVARVATDWVPRRLARFGVGAIAEADRALIASVAIAEQWIDDTLAFRERVAVAPPAPTRRPLVFEGAQGLLLDQHRGAFPHVTRSNTGLANVLALAPAYGIDRLDVVYATRAYTTRHGAGPLAHELAAAPAGVVDDTNTANPWQGQLRFAHLDLAVLAGAIAADRDDLGRGGVAARISLAVTCLDQVGDEVAFHDGDRTASAAPERLAMLAARRCGVARLLLGRGPSRTTLEERALL